MPRTLNLDEAAAMLHTSSDTVAGAIQNQGLPAVKVGRAWVLIDDDVIAWLRTRYPKKSDDTTEQGACDSTNGAKPAHGGSTSARQEARALAAALAPQTKKRRRNTPPRLHAISGGPSA